MVAVWYETLSEAEDDDEATRSFFFSVGGEREDIRGAEKRGERQGVESCFLAEAQRRTASFRS